MLQAELRILSGKHQGKSIPLVAKRFLVGREQDCHLRPNSDLVSRHHCVFITDDYAVRLRDLGSTNGTRVNGELIRGETVLKTGDKVQIGKLDLEVQLVEVPAAVPAALAAPVNDAAVQETALAPTAAEYVASPYSDALVTQSFSVDPAGSVPTFMAPIQEAGATVSIRVPEESEAPLNASAIETNYEMPTFGVTGDTALGIMAADSAQLAAGQYVVQPQGYGVPPQEFMQPGYAAAYPAAAQNFAPAYPIPAYPQQGYPVPGYPPAGYAQPGYGQFPPGYPAGYPGGNFPPQSGYPGGGYPAQGGYPAGYPAGAYPQQPAYPQASFAPPTFAPPIPAPEPEPVAVAKEVPSQEVMRLPPPEETGVKETTIGSGGAPTPGTSSAQKQEKPSNTAADIIKQYMQRRSR